jgi:hypothetical protein
VEDIYILDGAGRNIRIQKYFPVSVKRYFVQQVVNTATVTTAALPKMRKDEMVTRGTMAVYVAMRSCHSVDEYRDGLLIMVTN